MARHKQAGVFVAAVFLLLLLFPVAQVAAAGEFANITKGVSYDSIQEAIAAADSGDIIEVAAGTYLQTDVIVIDKALTLRSAPGAAAVIEGEPSLEKLFAVEAPGVILEGLTITGADDGSIAVYFDAPAFLAETSTRSFTLRGCTLEGGDSTYSAVILYGTAENAEIIISGNTIRNYTGYGLQSDTADELINSTVKVLNNSFTDAGNYGIDLDIPAAGTEICVTGNTVSAKEDAIYVDDLLEDSSLTIKDNTLSSRGEGIYFSDDIIDSTVLIEGNSITSEEEGIYFSDVIVESMITIKGNSISFKDGKGIYFYDNLESSGIIISENTMVSDEESAIHFNDDLLGCNVTAVDNVITARDGVNFNESLEDSTLILEGNVITAVYNGLYIYINVDSTVILQKNTFTIKPADYDGYAVCIDYQGDSLFQFRGNIVTGALTAVEIYDEGTASEITIAGNLFKKNGTGISLSWEEQIALAIAFNAFIENDDEILFEGPAAPAALLNWWGAAAGPTGLDKEIAFDPWLAALVLSPDKAVRTEGDSCTITARLLDSDGTLAGTDLLAVRFTVTGAHSLTRIVPMVNGEAVLQYVGNPAGADAITAEVLFGGEAAGLSGKTEVTWEAKPEAESDKELPATSGSPVDLTRIGFMMIFAAAAVHFCRRYAAISR